MTLRQDVKKHSANRFREKSRSRGPERPRMSLTSIARVLLAILITACLDPLDRQVQVAPGTSWAMRTENARVGAMDWDTGLYTTPDSKIAGYVLPFSASSRDTLHVFVTSETATVSISIYRLGWYDGVGARLVTKQLNRRVARQPLCSASLPGPSVCSWVESDRIPIDPAWVPGVYLAKFTDDAGDAAAVPFVLRSDRPSTFVVVLPFATYQAYNDWNGTSLYKGLDPTGQPTFANRAMQVSFARPFAHGTVRAHFLGLDYLLIRWLEQNAYDVSYVADFDFNLGRGAEPQNGAWLFAGHSEYWTWPMWVRATSARAQGTGIGFLGGNDIYWTARFEIVSAGGLEAPVVVCYRDSALDPLGSVPGQSTVRFRSPPNNNPENALVGVMSIPGMQIQKPPVDLVVANGADSLMQGTGLTTGDHIPGVGGWEGDRIVDNGATPGGIRVLFQSPYIPTRSSTPTGLLQATVYRWPQSGALVYASGDVGFAWGLSTYRQYVARPPLQMFLQNVLRAFLERNTGR